MEDIRPQRLLLENGPVDAGSDSGDMREPMPELIADYVATDPAAKQQAWADNSDQVSHADIQQDTAVNLPISVGEHVIVLAVLHIMLILCCGVGLRKERCRHGPQDGSPCG